MLPEISEFSYGYCFTTEAIRHYGILDAPIFPTQVQEADVGFDVQFNKPGAFRPLFFQYKRSSYLFRRNATNWNNFGSAAYYRFELMARRHSRQHQILIDLERIHPDVYYAAPRFHKYSQLNSLYQAKSIFSSSFIIKPSEIPTISDDGAHSISFGQTGSLFVMNSTSRKGEIGGRFSWNDEAMNREKSSLKSLVQFNEFLEKQFRNRREKFDEEDLSSIRGMGQWQKFLFFTKVGLGLDCLFKQL